MTHEKENLKILEANLQGLTPASAEAVFSNEDLLLEILLRVPAKSLTRFKCVSKYLLGLISDRQFGYDHATRNCEPISALYYQFDSCKYDYLKSVSLRGHISLPTLSFLRGIERNGTIQVVHTCSGLMLCAYGSQKKYIVCNLTTQKYVIISPPTERKGFVNRSSLAYDPAVSPYYKIVALGYRRSGSHPIDIYSSENSSWILVHAPELSFVPTNLTYFFKGSLHWMGSDFYFRFDVETQKLTKIRMLQRQLKINLLGECGGKLLLVQCASPFEDRLKIYEIEMETGRWMLKQSVSLWPINEALQGGQIRFILLTIFKGSNEGEEIILLLLTARGKIIAFYPNLKKFKVICDTSRISHLKYGGVYHHFESLSPV